MCRDAICYLGEATVVCIYVHYIQSSPWQLYHRWARPMEWQQTDHSSGSQLACRSSAWVLVINRIPIVIIMIVKLWYQRHKHWRITEQHERGCISIAWICGSYKRWYEFRDGGQTPKNKSRKIVCHRRSCKDYQEIASCWHHCFIAGLLRSTSSSQC